MKAFLGKIRQIVKANKQATAGNLIAQLNPVIRGWANYHRHVVSKATFFNVDTAIFKRSVVVGHTEASKEIRPMDCDEILSHAERPTVDLRGDTRGQEGNRTNSRSVVQETCRSNGM